LTLLTQAYSLAHLSNRTFLLDATRFRPSASATQPSDPEWVQHFLPLPAPLCTPPPPHALRACPRSTRHWLLSPATAAHHFGPASGYAQAFVDASGGAVAGAQWAAWPAFVMSRAGFDALLVPGVVNKWLIGMANWVVAPEEGKVDDGGGHVGLRLGNAYGGGNEQDGRVEWETAVAEAWRVERSLVEGLPDKPKV